jgi:hypothetical protein
MNDILKTLKLLDTMESKKPLTESAVAECGDMGAMAAPAPVDQGNPVTASITLNASGMNHVADLMRLLQQAGLEKAGPPAPAPMPMRMDMERLRDKMSGLEKPGMESSLADDIEGSDIEEWSNEPEEEYKDHNYMLDDLAGGINKPKRMYKPAAKGDNPMAVESIKDRLYRALSEKKAKPDFLDMDKDGDTKEPMKKAIADKKKKGPVKETALDEISSDLAKRYTKAAKMDRDFNDDDIARLAKSGQSTRDMHKKNAKRTKGIYRAKSRIENEAEVQMPTHELDQTARQATAVAQKIKRKINSGEQMDDRDYNQMAELGHVLSRYGAKFGPKSMKDVMNHMKQYTDDRNQEGHGYPEFDVNRFKELIAMAK